MNKKILLHLAIVQLLQGMEFIEEEKVITLATEQLIVELCKKNSCKSENVRDLLEIGAPAEFSRPGMPSSLEFSLKHCKADVFKKLLDKCNINQRKFGSKAHLLNLALEFCEKNCTQDYLEKIKAIIRKNPNGFNHETRMFFLNRDITLVGYANDKGLNLMNLREEVLNEQNQSYSFFLN